MKNKERQLSFSLLLVFTTLALGTLVLGGKVNAGEPSSTQAVNTSVFSDSGCVKKCQEICRKRIETCDTVYPPASRSNEHTDCLKKAKSEFDDCMSTCK